MQDTKGAKGEVGEHKSWRAYKEDKAWEGTKMGIDDGRQKVANVWRKQGRNGEGPKQWGFVAMIKVCF